MAKKLTTKGALSVTGNLDRLANLFQTEHETLGVEPKVAQDFAYRCDLLSDAIEKTAGVDRVALTELDVVQESGYDPEQIGEEKAGPMIGDADEPYMKGNFGQEEKRELRYDVEQGKIGPDRIVPEQKPLQPGKQAGFEVLGKQAAVNSLTGYEGVFRDASLRFANAGNTDLAKAFLKLAKSTMDAQVGILTGTRSASNISRLMEAIKLLAPHVAAVNPASYGEVSKMADLVLKVAGEDEEEEDDDDKEDAEPEDSKEAKKAGKKSEDEAKDDDKKDDKDEAKGKDEKKDESKEDFLKKMQEGKDKKSSHGFNLSE
jgi:hypothetical protein